MPTNEQILAIVKKRGDPDAFEVAGDLGCPEEVERIDKQMRALCTSGELTLATMSTVGSGWFRYRIIA
jgi:hypothetical protein